MKAIEENRKIIEENRRMIEEMNDAFKAKMGQAIMPETPQEEQKEVVVDAFNVKVKSKKHKHKGKKAKVKD